jgi:hypothetical protein
LLSFTNGAPSQLSYPPTPPQRQIFGLFIGKCTYLPHIFAAQGLKETIDTCLAVGGIYKYFLYFYLYISPPRVALEDLSKLTTESDAQLNMCNGHIHDKIYL